MSSEPRYYYVDAQNQAAGPIAMAGLMALKAAGTVTDATLVVIEGGADWVAFSTLKPAATAPAAATPQPATSPATATHSPAGTLPASSTAEPLWASQLSQKVDRLVATMEKLIVSLEKSRPPAAAVPVPATAALHAEKINLNPLPKPGIAALGSPASPSSIPGTASPRPAGIPAGLPVAAPRPSASSPLSPLAVPANAQKSAPPLPALGKAPGPTPGAVPRPSGPTPAPTTDPAKGNIFSKFLKK